MYTPINFFSPESCLHATDDARTKSRSLPLTFQKKKYFLPAPGNSRGREKKGGEGNSTWFYKVEVCFRESVYCPWSKKIAKSITSSLFVSF